MRHTKAVSQELPKKAGIESICVTIPIVPENARKLERKDSLGWESLDCGGIVGVSIMCKSA